MTVHAMKRDVFSAKTLMAIYEGVQALAEARAKPNSTITVTNFHKTLFERLRQSFNNPTLLKEVGLLYLGEFGMPSMALKHFDLARQFAPKDRDIEQLQKSAALAMARETSDQPGHSGLSEAVPSKVEMKDLLKKTVRINVVEARLHLDQTAGELAHKQAAWRKRVSENAVDLLAHLTFGAATALLADELAAQPNRGPSSDLTRRLTRVG